MKVQTGLVDLVPASTAWAKRGACVGHDPNVFFPTEGGSVDEAVTICSTCVVRAECLDYAVTTCVDAGVWGGTSARQRQRARRARRGA